ncbi:MAG TPA: hypothetical protein VFQ66_03125, partial [Candidatus Limnocylindria bacterium]|nr:hypothetical protein [Candidatus Limnocylindria bacterium]
CGIARRGTAVIRATCARATGSVPAAADASSGDSASGTAGVAFRFRNAALDVRVGTAATSTAAGVTVRPGLLDRHGGATGSL